MRALLLLIVALVATPVSRAAEAAAPAGSAVSIFNKTKGDSTLAEGQVDVAPGSVSAATLLGLAGDAVANIAHPRDVSLLLQGFDGAKTFGIAITPARTSITPMKASSYLSSSNWFVNRLVAATTLSYAQATTTIQGQDYRQRALSIDTSVYFGGRGNLDDPLVAYARRLGIAAEADMEGGSSLNQPSARDPCLVLLRATPEAGTSISAVAAEPGGPGSPMTPDLGQAEQDARAKACHEDLDKSARWNPSRGWVSFATGSFQPAGGGTSHGLGRTLVVGATWGFANGKDKSDAQLGGALTLGYKRTWREPILDTYAGGSPDTRDSNLLTLHAAYGTNKMRVLAEASNVRDKAPTATERAYKRAAGLDLQFGKGMWLNVRFGRQRRIDNAGDENGSSIAINLSPTAMTLLN